jgi:hypothetical protein
LGFFRTANFGLAGRRTVEGKGGILVNWEGCRIGA